MKHFKDRKHKALKRLVAQLESGVKTETGSIDKKIPLTDKDIKRISKEITILESKLKIT